ncbi:CIC11C00000000775 [Sungouiella intermedia]|uniref:CIC11C00000000775 n=1 Tax=Sungouiella intermedia TaxID=45354 RepID=A0A1L0DF90_9ASCO|nr:CIC11C00000000775 [[Candida] intermedia]
MTIIIGSLFLPYTVKFEVAQDDFNSDTRYLELSTASLATPIPIKPGRPPLRSAITNSILPSLSNVPTAAQTPSGSPPHLGIREIEGSAQLFFQKARKPSSDNATILQDTVNERLAPHLIQPKSRYLGLIPSLVIEAKKRDEDLGLSGLKISRSLTSLAAHPGLSRSGSSSSDFPVIPRGRSSISRQFSGFTLGNNSNSSLVIAEEDEPSRYFDPPHKLTLGDADTTVELENERLAPYGGFSRPDLEETFLSQRSVFDLAPWQVVKTDKGNGSLINAVHLAHEKGIINNVKWVGTMSLPSDAIPEKVMNKISDKLHEEYNCESVVVNDITFQGHYKSFCKQILWPTLHYQIPDDPKSKAFEEHSYHHYKLLNQTIADKLVATYLRENNHLSPDDPENMIWIHDYHLLLVPGMIREKLPDAKIGFFMHVSFPSSEVFKCLAQREALLQGMLGADCITFQTKEYVRHFLQTCSRLVLADTLEDGLTHDGTFTKVNTIPVGIDANDLRVKLSSNEVLDWKQLITERWNNQTLIVSRDHLDKLRGVKQKLLAYERFLRENPSYVETTVLLQIYMGTTDDDDYESEVMQIASRINSMSENISDTPPVAIVHQDIGFDQYIALLSEADVFIVSSMREGLNLTCHEFIVAAEKKKAPLILSEFTGSSNLLGGDGKGALLINPWDIKNFSDTIKFALNMLPLEKEKHWKVCNEIVTKHDSMDWIKGCIKSINDAWKKDSEKLSDVVPLSSTVFDKFYESATGGRLFFLSLDQMINRSTLYGGRSGSRDSFLEFSRIGSLLRGLISNPNNRVYVTSAMKKSEMYLIFKNTPNIGLVAESGGYIRIIGESKWFSLIDEKQVNNWKPQVSQLIKSKAERLPGSSAVIEDCTVRLLADTSMAEDPKRSLDVMGDCIQHINEAYEESQGVHATIVDNSVFVLEKNITLRALNILLAIYTTDISVDAISQKFNIKRVLSSTDALFRSESNNTKNDDRFKEANKVTSLFYAGGLNPLDETVFDSISQFEKDGVLDSTLSVVVRGNRDDTRTSATYTVSGLNELFGILSKAGRR